MRDQKNVYLLTVESTNAASKRFYSVDLPQLLENMQSLKESETTSFKSLLTAFCTLDRSSHEQLLRHLEVVSTSCNAIDAASDCAMFSRHNRKGIADAPKFSFESTPMWVDNSELEQDHESRVVLVNKLAKHRARLSDVGDEVAGKSKEVMGLTTLRDSYRRDPHLGDPEVVHEQLLDSQRDLVFLDITRAKLQAQIDTISGQIGDAQQDGPSHKFKQSNFTLPTACDLCGQSIWGMGKGRACSECGFNVHNRCELKVPPVCSCVKGSGHTRPASSGSRKTSYNADTASNRASVIANGADQSPNASGRLSPGSLLGAGGRVLTTMESSISVTSSLSRAIYSYTKQDDEEISIKSGDVVQIIEQDSDGWTKISVDGREGIVPTSYLEPCSAASGSTPSTATTMTHGLSPSSATQKARTLGSATMLYDYDAQNDEEVSVKEGSPVKLVEDERDGWVKVAFNGREGLVPVSYLQIR
ncbi:hypothetical protein M427DRAFT_476751 [Gonapodya prolifera JEL478]|uniref:SH3-domain-containing protein n=1 Tax=Gonapodya prolifera (strain JEL478) TaxID=1344416 RepID=A0A139A111_GONPJ|nr:hypothetical protein M427DRAFT_476751 [Gonapodya prolifera JEL478]|eukprot:KXS10459.1 hypothetical protein M427DRAFT_476751 [Gonapodya prolifera JEL478]